MQRSTWTVLLGAALCAYLVYSYQQVAPQPTPCPCPPTKPAPKPDGPKKPPPKPRGPCGPGPCPSEVLNAVSSTAKRTDNGKPVVGGIDSPDGAVHILFLPDTLNWPKNIPARGLGCCGFRSIDYCARVQNVPEVVNLPEQLKDAGMAGGDYPQKHAQVMERFAPKAHWWQDTTGSMELIQACLKSQRPCCVDYNGHDPHYHGTIAHCVTVVACDTKADWVAILDNNYPSLDEIVWMRTAEFKQRWHGWSYGLLAETPGHYCVRVDSLRPNAPDDPRQGPIFGGNVWPLVRGDTTIDNVPATTAEIIDSFGGEFAPKLPAIPVNVDHRIDLENLQTPALAAAAAAFALWVITSKKGRE